MTDVRIRSGLVPGDDSTIEVAGQDITQKVHDVGIHMARNEINEVAIILREGVDLQIDAEVTVIHPGLSAEHLEGITAQAIHDKAASMPWGDSVDLVENVLTILKGLASGDQSGPG